MKKITVVGAGHVGSTVTQLCAYKRLGDIVLVNRTLETAKALVLDLLHSSPLEGEFAIEATNDYKLTKNSDVVVITAGAQRKEGMSRDELLEQNANIVGPAVNELARYSPDAVMIVVTNPLDAMAYLAMKTSGFSRKKVVGMAGILDTSRFISFLSQELQVSVKDIQALVLGGHGDSMVPLISYTTVSGIPITQFLPEKKIKQIVDRTRNAGAEIINLGGDSAFYAPASSVVQMIEAIVKDEKRVLPCSVYLDGEYGIKGVFLGVPIKLGENGLEEIIEIRLTDQEKKLLNSSAAGVRDLIKSLKL